MIFWIVWIAIGAGIVVLAAALVLPRIMVKMHAATLPVRDHAMGKHTDGDASEFLYEPSPSVRQYIKSYRIAKDGAGLYFCGEWNRKVAFIKYEIVVYNASDNIVNILRVKEKFNDGDTTHITRLPKSTDFVTVRILCVDDTPVRVERKPFNVRYALWFALLCLVLVFAVDLLLWLGITLVLRLLDNFTGLYSIPIRLWAEVLGFAALGVVVITCIFTLAPLFLMRKKGEEHDR